MIAPAPVHLSTAIHSGADSDRGHFLVASSLCRGEGRSSEAAVDVTHDRIRGIAVDLALNAVPLLHFRKPVVQVALGQEVQVVASAGLHVYVFDDPVREHHRLRRQSMYFVVSIVALALHVVISARATNFPDGAVNKTDQV